MALFRPICTCISLTSILILNQPIRVVTQEIKIDHKPSSVSAVSDSAAPMHVSLSRAWMHLFAKNRPQIPFDRERASSLSRYVSLHEQDTLRVISDPEKITQAIGKAVTREDIDHLVRELLFQLTNIEEIDPEIELTDQAWTP
jgi:hypothetical protein